MNSYLNEIQQKLRAVIEREKRRDGLKRLFVFVAVVCIVSLVLVLLEAFVKFDSGVRTVLFWTVITLFVLAFCLYVALPFLKDLLYYVSPDYVNASKKIGAHFPGIKDELANTVQLLYEKNNNYSGELVDAAFQNVYSKTKNLDFTKIVDFTLARKYFRIGLITFVVSLVVISFVPGLSSAALRLINFNKKFSPPPKFVFEITPGNIEIAKGEDVAIRIKAIGEKPAEVVLST
ncbi:hypothetical protein C0389_09500, partial [bacterium]|nr:hypothetical protein [bacterium]